MQNDGAAYAVILLILASFSTKQKSSSDFARPPTKMGKVAMEAELLDET